MTITFKGYKKYGSESIERRCYKVEHKGKSLEYMPPNGWTKLFPMSLRNCLIRTLKSKYNEVWA